MNKYIVMYSTTNNKPYESADWHTVTETEALDKAVEVMAIWTNKAATEDNTQGWPIYGKITQVAIFRLAGGETFTRKPLRYADYRDKRDWAISDQVGGLVNAVNSDFTINKAGREQS